MYIYLYTYINCKAKNVPVVVADDVEVCRHRPPGSRLQDAQALGIPARRRVLPAGQLGHHSLLASLTSHLSLAENVVKYNIVVLTIITQTS